MSTMIKDSFGRYIIPPPPEITGHEEEIQGLLNAFADSIIGTVGTPQEAIVVLNLASSGMRFIVDFINTHSSEECPRVCGKSIKALVDSTISAKIAEQTALLPDPEPASE